MGAFLSGTATLFGRLIAHSVEISLLICLLFFVKWIAAKKLPSWWHYSLWLMLLVRMLLPLEFENRLNVFNFIPDIRENQVFGMITDPSFEKEISASEITPTSPPIRSDWRALLKSTLPLLWLAGAMMFGISISFKSISFWRSVRRLPPVTDKEVLHLLAQCKNRMKIRAAIDVIVTDKVRSPALFGYLHPRLLLPKGIFERISNEDLTYAFMHELGHLKRHDIGVSWLAAFLQVAYWFNPLVWVAFYQMRIDQESACDESVLSRIQCHQSTDYAKAIVGFLEKFYQNCQLPSLAGVMENNAQMKRRIAGIVHYKRYSHKLTIAAVALFFSTGFIFYLFTGVAEEKQMQSAAKAEMEKPFAAVTSVAGGEDITRAEIIPADLPVTHAEVTPKPLHLVQGDIISHSNGRDEYSTDTNRIVQKTVELSAGPGDRTLKASPSAVMEPERKRETGGYSVQTEEARASALESGPDDSGQYTGLNPMRAANHSETDASVANAPMPAEVADEKLPGSEISHPIAKTDREEEGGGGSLGISQVDIPPRVVRAVPPQYPFMAKRNDITGYIKLRFTVTKDGDAIDTTVVESNPKGVFDKSALEAIESYRFKPGIKDGKAVDVQVSLPIKFKLS